MKKALLLFFCCLMSMATWAVKADPTPVTITQPDGTRLTVRLNGDEDLHWYSTADGVLLVQQDMAYYVAQVNADGTLLATNVLAHESANRSDAERALIASQDKTGFQEKAPAIKQRRMAKRLGDVNGISPATNAAYFPHTGSPKVLVILVNFSDTTFKVADPQLSFGEYLNGTGPFENHGAYENRNHGSVRQYFTSMSKGTFTPQFDLVGPVTLANPTRYYGGSNANGSDEKMSDLVKDACTLVDGEVDFSQYDSDSDGKVDLLYIIYAGWGQSHSGVPDYCIWPKSGTTAGGSYDGKAVYRYGVSNELNFYPGQYKVPRIEGIGLFCHEFTHTLGLPDLYATVSAAKIDDQAMERWDLMDEGEYLDNGYCPTPYTPWEQETMGWVTLETLTGAQHVVMQPGDAKKIAKEGESQYLTLLNVQPTDWFIKMPYHGLLISRIDYKKVTGGERKDVSVVNSGDYPNNCAGAPGITIVPADGKLITSWKMYTYDDKGNPVGKDDYHCYSPEEYLKSLYGDPFPGTQNVTQLLSVNLNDGKVIDDQPLYKITENTETGVVSFNFIDENLPTGIESIDSETGYGKPANNQSVYTLDGRYAGNNLSVLPKGIYIINHKKVVIK